MIPYVDLAAQYEAERDELLPILDAVLRKGQWVGGPEIEQLEDDLSHYTDCPHVVAVGSGTDALILGLRSLDIGPGDEVITPPNSFVASTAAIVAVGAKPVFVDVAPDQNIDPDKLDAAITANTRAIMPVHLTGRVADMPAIQAIAEHHGLWVIEDAAQAIGAKFGGRGAGTFGDVGCFSAHPLKNLNAAGDGGFVLTGDRERAARIRRLRNHGLRDRDTVAHWGTVSRLDAIQAAILRFRLTRLDATIEARRARAARYAARLDPRWVLWPEIDRQGRFDTFHTFVVQVEHRDDLQRWLRERNIGSSIHYPTPIHLQPAAASLGYGQGDFPVAEAQAQRVLSLPIHPGVDLEAIDAIVETIHAFFDSP